LQRIELKVITRSKKEEILRISDGIYKVKVSVPPEKGKANKRILDLVSREFGVKKHHVRIVSGKMNTRKIIEIDT